MNKNVININNNNNGIDNDDKDSLISASELIRKKYNNKLNEEKEKMLLLLKNEHIRKRNNDLNKVENDIQYLIDNMLKDDINHFPSSSSLSSSSLESSPSSNSVPATTTTSSILGTRAIHDDNNNNDISKKKPMIYKQEPLSTLSPESHSINAFSQMFVNDNYNPNRKDIVGYNKRENNLSTSSSTAAAVISPSIMKTNITSNFNGNSTPKNYFGYYPLTGYNYKINEFRSSNNNNNQIKSQQMSSNKQSYEEDDNDDQLMKFANFWANDKRSDQFVKYRDIDNIHQYRYRNHKNTKQSNQIYQNKKYYNLPEVQAKSEQQRKKEEAQARRDRARDFDDQRRINLGLKPSYSSHGNY